MSNAIKIKIQICILLGWTEFDYCDFQYNSGLKYLEKFVCKDVIIADEIARSKQFWSWWKNAWEVRDDEFVFTHQNIDCIKILRHDYRALNNPAELVGNIRPNAIVLQESYARMMQHLIDEINQPA